MAIVLPLGVVARQLWRIEADLRRLNMKSLDFGKQQEDALAGRIEAGLDSINEALDSIRDLVSGIEDRIGRSPGDGADASTQEREPETGSFPDALYVRANRKPHPDRDD
jgi:hypothetical protein